MAAAVAAGADAAAAAGPAAAGAGVAAGVAVAAAGADAAAAAGSAAAGAGFAAEVAVADAVEDACCAANHGDGALPGDGSMDAPCAVVGALVGGSCGGGGGCTELAAAAPYCGTGGSSAATLHEHRGHSLHTLQTQLVQTGYPYQRITTSLASKQPGLKDCSFYVQFQVLYRFYMDFEVVNRRCFCWKNLVVALCLT